MSIKTTAMTAKLKFKEKGGDIKMKKSRVVNSLKIQFPAKSANEAFSRALISSFAAQLDPTVEELCDIKTAVSEAVTNCIVHAYDDSVPEKKKIIKMHCFYDENNLLSVKITDNGRGIEDVKKAMEPLYTTGGEDRSGMGFPIMQSFTDELKVKSVLYKGTTVTLKKYIGKTNYDI